MLTLGWISGYIALRTNEKSPRHPGAISTVQKHHRLACSVPPQGLLAVTRTRPRKTYQEQRFSGTDSKNHAQAWPMGNIYPMSHQDDNTHQESKCVFFVWRATQRRDNSKNQNKKRQRGLASPLMKTQRVFHGWASAAVAVPPPPWSIHTWDGVWDLWLICFVFSSGCHTSTHTSGHPRVPAQGQSRPPCLLELNRLLCFMLIPDVQIQHTLTSLGTTWDPELGNTTSISI